MVKELKDHGIPIQDEKFSMNFDEEDIMICLSYFKFVFQTLIHKH